MPAADLNSRLNSKHFTDLELLILQPPLSSTDIGDMGYYNQWM